MLTWAHLCILIGKKDILILGKDPKEGLDGTAVTPKAEYSANFMEQRKKFCLSLHYNGINSYLCANAT